MWKILGFLLFVIAQLTFGATGSYAASVGCSVSSPFDFAPTLNTSAFGRDSAIGSTTPNYSTSVNFNCSGDPAADRDIYMWFQASPATLVSGYSDVFTTNVPGVGVRYTISNGAGTSCNSMPVTVSSGSRQVTCHQLLQAISPGQNYSLTVSAEFVKIANGAVGQLTTIPALVVTNGINNQSTNKVWGNIFSGSASGGISVLACSVTTPTVAVTMPQTNTSRLPIIGSTDGTTSFDMGLNCDPGVKAYVTLTDVTAPSNRTSTLSLTANSTARGVGYQVLYNNSPVAFGPDSAVADNLNQFAVLTNPAAGGPVSIPLSARYIRTGAPQPGTANGQATFTMSYQ